MRFRTSECTLYKQNLFITGKLLNRNIVYKKDSKTKKRKAEMRFRTSECTLYKQNLCITGKLLNSNIVYKVTAKQRNAKQK